ncbi:MAG TPA: glycosyltransferase [Patescibacteria group bacterium]|nr:glycosyltransferase [Patescibacteria group bacterium]
MVHDFFATDGGGEAVAIEFARLLPHAPVYTSFFDSARFGDRIDPGRVRTWPLQHLRGAERRFRSLLPLYPVWFSLLDLRSQDFVLSSSVAFSKAVRTRRGAVHVSYVYTPMRYAWDLDTYLAGSSYSLPSRLAARTLRPFLRAWDRSTAQRPTHVVAISQTVRDRVRNLWGRDAEVVYPPVATDEIRLGTVDDGFLLVAARFLAYRRIDLAVAAATALGRELVVVGDGPESARLRASAGPTVRFLGRVDRPTLVDLFARCHAYLVPGVEDFGIAPVEAMAAGKPVIAFRSGGATETVVEGRTGLFFERQEVASLAEAIERLDGLVFAPAVIRARAEEFDSAVFRRSWRHLLVRLGVDPAVLAPPREG